MRRLYVLLGIALVLGVLLAFVRIDFHVNINASPNDIYTLSNNTLRAAYLVPTTSAQTTIRLIVQSGERDNRGTPGIPHYVEHLAWLNAIGANEALTDRHTNAFTSALATEYLLTVPAEQTEAALMTLSRVFSPFSLDYNFMMSERDIILREDDMRSTDNPLGEYVDKINEISYLEDPIARSVMGSRSDIATFRLEEARDWHASTHRPENATLLIASSLSKQEVANLVSRVFAGPNRSFIPAGVVFWMGPAETIERRFIDARFGQGIVNFQKMVVIEPPLKFAAQLAQLSLLYDILDSTLAGSYARPLRFEGKIAQSYDLQLFAHSDRHYELAFLAIRPDAGRSLEDVYQGLAAAVAAADIPQETFDRVKERWLKRVQDQDRAELAFDLAYHSAVRRVALVTPDEYLSAASAITLADMNRFARAFAGQGRTIVDMISPQ